MGDVSAVFGALITVGNFLISFIFKFEILMENHLINGIYRQQTDDQHKTTAI